MALGNSGNGPAALALTEFAGVVTADRFLGEVLRDQMRGGRVPIQRAQVGRLLRVIVGNILRQRLSFSSIIAFFFFPDPIVALREMHRVLDPNSGRIAVYTMLEQGIIPAIRLGRRWIVTRHAFENWERTCGMPDAPCQWADVVSQSVARRTVCISAIPRACETRA